MARCSKTSGLQALANSVLSLPRSLSSLSHNPTHTMPPLAVILPQNHNTTGHHYNKLIHPPVYLLTVFRCQANIQKTTPREGSSRGRRRLGSMSSASNYSPVLTFRWPLLGYVRHRNACATRRQRFTAPFWSLLLVLAARA